ncbi:hypothetical protein LCGC14_0845860 [marine sediment metagenome]|uniref:Uncharacterized protein n=1 Tax=marine sediment metagenome TaxID=412755 RepID=A0A0F9PBU1_9ZZZZ
MRQVTREDILLLTAGLEEQLDELIQAVARKNWQKADKYASGLHKQAWTCSAKINQMIDQATQ